MKLYRFYWTFVVGFLVFWVVGVGNAFATFIKYTDHDTFFNAVTTANFLATYEAFDTNPGNPFTVSDASNSVTLELKDGSFSSSENLLADSKKVKLKVDNIIGDVFGIGFDFSVDNNKKVYIKVGGDKFSSASDFGFLGILSTDGMKISDKVEIKIEDNDKNFAKLDNLVVATPQVSHTPEPSTWLLFAVGTLGIIGIGYRQRKKVA